MTLASILLVALGPLMPFIGHFLSLELRTRYVKEIETWRKPNQLPVEARTPVGVLNRARAPVVPLGPLVVGIANKRIGLLGFQ
jgi:hypothetical protein